MDRSPAARLATCTRDRFGVFTPREVQRAGVSRAQISRMEARGEVERLARGVYTLVAFPDSWERRAMAFQLMAGDGAALSHGTAARILGLEHLRTGRHPRLEATAPRHRRPSSGPIDVHESSLLLPEDIVEVGCFRVTSPMFTIGAMASRRAPQVIAKALDAAIADRRFDVTAVRELTIRMWHTPGVVHLREALVLVTPGAELTRSEKERLFLRICLLFELPTPEVNVRVIDANGDLRYVDFLFRELGLIIEINAHPSHGTTLGVRLDGSRQNALTPRFQVLNYDGDDLTQRPEVVAGEVRRALDELATRR